jgi:hypothetical protein
MVQSLAVKVQVSSTPTVSCHAFTLFAFEPVTSTKQISLLKTALNATAQMQPSADISQNLGTQLIFQLIDVSISNKDEMRSFSQLAGNENKGHFNDQTAPTFRLIVRLKQQYQSKMQWDLVNNFNCQARHIKYFFPMMAYSNFNKVSNNNALSFFFNVVSTG